MTSDSSDDDLPPPSLLFDRLLASTTRLKSTEPTSFSGSINKPLPSTLPLSINPSTPHRASSAPSRASTRQERRSSPRLAEKRVKSQPPSSSPPPNQRDPALPVQAREDEYGIKKERERHSSLAAELFPPSPPQTHSTSQTTSPSIISDSEVEPERVGDAIDQKKSKEKGRKCDCEEAIEGRRTREGTIVSDSEAENHQLLREKKKKQRESRGKTARKPRVSNEFTLSSSEGEGEAVPRNKDQVRANHEKKLDQDGLADSLNRLNLASNSLPSKPSAPFPPSRFRSQSPTNTYLAPSLLLENPSTPLAPKQTVRTPHRRRITISIASSSSSSPSEDESDPPITNTKKTPRSRSRSKTEEDAEIVIVETDDDDEVLPIASEPELGSKGVQNENKYETDWSGSRGYKGMQDVWENDGVLIYEPTPKKRPTKLKPSTSTAMKPSSSSSPFLRPPLPSSSSVPLDSPTPTKSILLKDGRTKFQDSPTRPAGTSKRRVEIDLTGSSSSSDDEDDRPPPPRATIPSRSFPFTPTGTSSKPSKPSTNPTTTTPRPKSKPVPSSCSSNPLLTPSDRAQLPLQLIRELDRSVFRKKWEGLRCVRDEGGEGLPDGLEVVWNNRLLKTAGRAKWKQIKSPGKETVHKTTIELATKVTDTEEKLKHTLSHELCHIAAWILSKESNPPHGNAFKLWAKRIMLVRKDIEVTTTHDYQIVYKYRWQCDSSSCGKIFGRHSNSINPLTHGCPCGGKLRGIDKDGNLKKIRSQVVMVEGEDGTMIETPKKKKSPWLEFVATQSPIVRKEMSGIAQSEVLKVVAERWKLAKEELTKSAIAAVKEKEKEKEKERREEGELGEAFEKLKV